MQVTLFAGQGESLRFTGWKGQPVLLLCLLFYTAEVCKRRREICARIFMLTRISDQGFGMTTVTSGIITPSCCDFFYPKRREKTVSPGLLTLQSGHSPKNPHMSTWVKIRTPSGSLGPAVDSFRGRSVTLQELWASVWTWRVSACSVAASNALKGSFADFPGCRGGALARHRAGACSTVSLSPSPGQRTSERAHGGAACCHG